MRSSPLTSQTSSTSGARQFGCAAAGYEASVITDRIAKPWVSEPPMLAASGGPSGRTCSYPVGWAPKPWTAGCSLRRCCQAGDREPGSRSMHRNGCCGDQRGCPGSRGGRLRSTSVVVPCDAHASTRCSWAWMWMCIWGRGRARWSSRRSTLWSAIRPTCRMIRASTLRRCRPPSDRGAHGTPATTGDWCSIRSARPSPTCWPTAPGCCLYSPNSPSHGAPLPRSPAPDWTPKSLPASGFRSGRCWHHAPRGWEDRSSRSRPARGGATRDQGRQAMTASAPHVVRRSQWTGDDGG